MGQKAVVPRTLAHAVLIAALRSISSLLPSCNPSLERFVGFDSLCERESSCIVHAHDLAMQFISDLLSPGQKRS